MLLERELSTKSLPPLKNMVFLSRKNNTVLKKTDEVFKQAPPKLYAEASYAELTEKLKALKEAAAKEDTPVS